MVNSPNADTAGRFLRTHETLSMRVGKGKASSDIVNGSKKGSREDGTALSVWKQSVVEKEENISGWTLERVSRLGAAYLANGREISRMPSLWRLSGFQVCKNDDDLLHTVVVTVKWGRTGECE